MSDGIPTRPADQPQGAFPVEESSPLTASLSLPPTPAADALPGPSPSPSPAVTGDFPGTDSPPTLASPLPVSFPFLASPGEPGELGRLAGYRLLEVLGQGGMGVVFWAEDLVLRRPAAVKVMKPAVARDPRQRQRFLREGRAAAALRHDNVITIYEVGQAGDVPFLVMELLQGVALDQWLKRGRLPTQAQVLRLGREIALGLAAAHDKGLIHRDIKPGNLWLEAPAGRVKILDFGLARNAADDEIQLTQAGVILGTPAYMAPEQIDQATVDARCDLFSLGCVLYQLCTGRMPFTGPTTAAILKAITLNQPPPPRQVNPQVGPALSDLVMHLLAKEPAQRPASARAVAQALQDLAAPAEAATLHDADAIPEDDLFAAPPLGEAAAGAETGSPAPSPTAPAPRRVRWAAAALLAVFLMALALWAARSLGLWEGPGNAGPRNQSAGTKRGNALLPLDPLPEEDNPSPPDQGPPGKKDFLVNSIGMKLVRIRPGKCLMGSPSGEAKRNPDEDQHEVEITRSFFMGVHEVTQDEYQRVMGANPSSFSSQGKRKAAVKGIDTSLFPVESVTWQAAKMFCDRLSRQPDEQRLGRVYRLPTEAEWEYACRAGRQTRAGGTIRGPRSLGRPVPVGASPANAFGLHDMQGSLWEWCSDWYGPYPKGPIKDPTGPAGGKERILRGSCWNDNGGDSLHRVARRWKASPQVCMLVAAGGINGLRVVCDAAGGSR